MHSHAGASARQEARARREARERRVRARHPRIGGLILALTNEPTSTIAWDIGARAEEEVGEVLDAIEGVRALHDRIRPGATKANLDHVVVTPAAVVVIDTKRYTGRIDASRSELRVAGRDRTKLVAAVSEQVAAVQQIVGAEVPVQGRICFVNGDFSLVSAKVVRGIRINTLRGLRRALEKQAAADRLLDVDAIADQLDLQLTPAVRSDDARATHTG